MSHNQAMEQQTVTTDILTEVKEENLTLTKKEADEFFAYKRKLKQNEITTAFTLSGGMVLTEKDIHRVCERAIRLNQSVVKVRPLQLKKTITCLKGSKVKTDCMVGGNGETLFCVKAFELKQALKFSPKAITYTLSIDPIEHCNYVEIRREIKKVRKLTKNVILKIRVDKPLSPNLLGRVARICAQLGVNYFSVPYYVGCQRLKLDLMLGCKLEVTDVKQLNDFKELYVAGVNRIITDAGWELYSKWQKELEDELSQCQKAEKPSPLRSSDLKFM